LIIQGRRIGEDALATIGALLQRQPPLSRRQLSLHLCSAWNWRTDTGQYKDIAARSLLRKLEQRGLILLPPIKHLPWAARSCQVKSAPAPALGLLPSPQPVAAGLAELSPIELSIVATKSDRRLWAQFLEQDHYLSWNRPIGESIAYWAQTQGRSRQDRFHQLDLPRKSIWMAVLEPHDQPLLHETPGLAS
jgi:hypothetical protein